MKPICDENLHSVFIVVFSIQWSLIMHISKNDNLILSMFSLLLHVLLINVSFPYYYELKYQFVEAEYLAGSGTSIWVPFEVTKQCWTLYVKLLCGIAQYGVITMYCTRYFGVSFIGWSEWESPGSFQEHPPPFPEMFSVQSIFVWQ